METTGLLRKALLGNAAFSTTCAALIALWGGGIANWMGLASAEALYGLAPGLLGFAAWLVYISRGEGRTLVRNGSIAIAMDASWVVGTAVLLLAVPDALDSGGTWLALGVADTVAIFGGLQLAGVVRASRALRAEPAQSSA